jgi:hypothetical protein
LARVSGAGPGARSDNRIDGFATLLLVSDDAAPNQEPEDLAAAVEELRARLVWVRDYL